MFRRGVQAFVRTDRRQCYHCSALYPRCWVGVASVLVPRGMVGKEDDEQNVFLVLDRVGRKQRSEVKSRLEIRGAHSLGRFMFVFAFVPCRSEIMASCRPRVSKSLVLTVVVIK